MRNVRVYEEAWPLHTPFVIARGSRSEAKVVVVELEEDGVKGVGECTPYPRYGESIASVMAQIMTIGEQLERGITREQLAQLFPIISMHSSGSIAEMVVRGNPIQIQQKLSVFHPLLCETVPLTLEEIFITEMEVVGYDYNNVIF